MEKDKHTNSTSFHAHVVIMKAYLIKDSIKVTAKDWIRFLKILLIRRDHTKLHNIIVKCVAIISYFIKY